MRTKNGVPSQQIHLRLESSLYSLLLYRAKALDLSVNSFIRLLIFNAVASPTVQVKETTPNGD